MAVDCNDKPRAIMGKYQSRYMRNKMLQIFWFNLPKVRDYNIFVRKDCQKIEDADFLEDLQ